VDAVTGPGVRAGAVAWECRPCEGVEAFLDHARAVLRLTEGCDLAVWPEQCVLEIMGGRPDLDAPEAARYLADCFEEVRSGLAEAVRGSGQTVVAGTHFVRRAERIENSPLVVRPDGSCHVLPGKNVLTRYEADDWGLAPGEGLGVLDDASAGVLVCYDSEFSGSARALAEAGCLALLVPYFTQDLHGYHRIRHTGQARAVELQTYVLLAGLVGSLGREPVPATAGDAAVLAPCVEPFPADGVLAATPPGREGAAVADLDFGTLVQARAQGDVRNWDDRERGTWRVTSRA
jgi:predicted amidohydrolase